MVQLLTLFPSLGLVLLEPFWYVDVVVIDSLVMLALVFRYCQCHCRRRYVVCCCAVIVVAWFCWWCWIVLSCPLCVSVMGWYACCFSGRWPIPLCFFWHWGCVISCIEMWVFLCIYHDLSFVEVVLGVVAVTVVQDAGRLQWDRGWDWWGDQSWGLHRLFNYPDLLGRVAKEPSNSGQLNIVCQQAWTKP